MSRSTRTTALLKGIIALLALTVVLCFYSEPCLAAGEVGAGGSYVATSSVGTVIGAALETAGYRAQAQVLDQLKEMSEGIGALVFLGCIVSALLTFALHGDYRATLWLAIGPALLFFLVRSTAVGSGAEWQFGTFKAPAGSVEQLVGPRGQSKVSWFFHHYNILISSISQNLINIFQQDGLKAKLKFTTRQRIMDELLRTNIGSPGLNALNWYTLSACSSELNEARLVALGNRDPNFKNSPEYKTAQTKFNRGYTLKNKFVPSGEVQNYLVYLVSEGLDNLPVLSQTANPSQNPGEDIKHPFNECSNTLRSSFGANGGFLNKPVVTAKLSTGVSCEQLWCAMGIGIAEHVYEEERETIRNHGWIGYSMDEEAKIRFEILQDIVTKLTPPVQRTNERHEIDPNIPAFTKPDPSLIPVIIGGHLLRKVMMEDSRVQGVNQVARRTGYNVKPFNEANLLNEDHIQMETIRANQDKKATGARTSLFAFAMSLPYIQGVILYFLAMSFPFFAANVLIPGQAGAFFVWMGLWAWVKLWDVSWALVMAIDDVLWNLMPHNGTYNPESDPNHGPISILEAAFDGDPTYSLANYYGIISVLLIGGPILTAGLVLGAKRALAGTLISSLSDMAAALEEFHQSHRAIGIQRSNLYQTEIGRARWALDHSKHEMDRRLGLIKDESDEQNRRGNVLKVGGLALVGIGLGVLVAGLLTGGVAWGVAAGALAMGGASYAGGTDMKRASNSTKAEFYKVNGRLAWSKSGKSRQFIGRDMLRAGVSLRGEFWNVPGGDPAVFAKANQILAKAEATTSQITWGTMTDVAISGLTAGRLQGAGAAVQGGRIGATLLNVGAGTAVVGAGVLIKNEVIDNMGSTNKGSVSSQQTSTIPNSGAGK